MMYQLKMAGNGNGIIKQGSLPQLVILAQRLRSRTGMEIISIKRWDGSFICSRGDKGNSDKMYRLPLPA